MITVFKPRISVTLYKTVNRTAGVAPRYSTAARAIDLTPYLGDSGAVRTSKATNEAAGGFTVTFPDQPDPNIQDTLYALIEPQDIIEIRAARNPAQYPSGRLPLIMRGFVSAVRRPEGMGSDGRPRRMVVVQGQDFGKLLLINQVYNEFLALVDDAMLNTYQLSTVTGIPVAILPVNQFMESLILTVLNAKIAAMSAFTNHQVQPFTVQASVPDGVVLPAMGASYANQPFWHLVETFADRPFNEAFVRDSEAGPILIFRPVPWRDLAGHYIMNGAADPGTVKLDIADVVSLDVARTDAGVANIFYVPPGISTLDSNGLVGLEAIIDGTALDFPSKANPGAVEYINNAPSRYGVRMMTVGSNLVPSSTTAPLNMVPPAERTAAVGALNQWYEARTQMLKLLNRDNVVWEAGTIQTKGSEAWVIGQYAQLTRGDLVADYYVEAVSHTIIPFQTWTTALQVVRGTGFLVRDAYAGSPYAAEGRQGPYTPGATRTHSAPVSAATGG